jgi:riboflavin kinase/FMN adenylyltransferase
VESYLLNFSEMELDYSANLRLHFLARIREEHKWPNPEALKAQIMKDVALAKRYFRLIG